MSASQPNFQFYEFSFEALFDPFQLQILQRRFEHFLQAANGDLFALYQKGLQNPHALSAAEDSKLLCEVAPHLERFMVQGLGDEVAQAIAHIQQAISEEKLRQDFKREVVIRRLKGKRAAAMALSETQSEALIATLLTQMQQDGAGADLSDELALARWTLRLIEVQGDVPLQLQEALAALLWSSHARAPSSHAPFAATHWPHTLDYQNLLHAEAYDAPGDSSIVALGAAPSHLRERPGFQLTDSGGSLLQVMDEAHYCIICHPREKDSCSHGLKDKALGTPHKNPLGVALNGCPLDERISEYHQLLRSGHVIGALAVVMRDNPMCPGTGHRICNDCMKGCIFQKQTPVNIPMTETGVLKQILSLPFGVEIYGLLTRFNPLHLRRPVMLPHHGKRVLIVGLGPAGYTLAHYLLNEGFGVVAVDGLKLEPLPEEWLHQPIRTLAQIQAPLDERTLFGFGGVSEYGITVRWDKNFLTLMYLTLSRQRHFLAIGGVRLGGTLTIEEAWAMGFDHIALATGAGSPTLLNIGNNLARGMRQASDFLMGLQLSGAFKANSLANLQVRLPALVIGGGLTAIDTATELLAYYPVQVMRVLQRHEQLLASHHEAAILAHMNEEDRAIYQEFLTHARAIRAEQRTAQKEGRPPRLVPLLHAFGGVHVVYRKRLIDSPAYRLNHEEVEKAFEEGVRMIENLNPEAAELDAFGALQSMRFSHADTSAPPVTLPVRTLCVAAGTKPNTTYEKERPGTFQIDLKSGYFNLFHPQLDAAHQVTALQEAAAGEGFLTSYWQEGRTISCWGDNHPRYAGSVVKAMASAKHGHLLIAHLFAPAVQTSAEALTHSHENKTTHGWPQFAAYLREQLCAYVVSVQTLAPNIVEVVVKAPQAARQFKPGQFYRLQNFERLAGSNAQSAQSPPRVMEGLALTGAETAPEQGLLSMIVLEIGVSSRLCRELRPGEPVVVMGPTGTPTHLPSRTTVVLCGGGLGNAVLFSIGAALRANGCQVLYFAAYRHSQDLFKRAELERAADAIVYCTEQGAPPEAMRPADRHFSGNILEAMLDYGAAESPDAPLSLKAATHLIAIGSDRMMSALTAARHAQLKPYLNPNHEAIGSINSPMQCMMKEICAQCLQRHIDPKTGRETFVFSCANQDQPLDAVDWENLRARLTQNRLLETQLNLWFK